MQIAHREYLERILQTKKLELSELHISHRIFMAGYNIREDLIQEQIDSIERQLQDGIEE